MKKSLKFLMLALTVLSLLFTVIGRSDARAALARKAVQTTARATVGTIQAENSLPGTTNWYLTKPSPQNNTNWSSSQGIEGYPLATSVKAGSIIRFAVNTAASSFKAETYRLGWYGGLGANLKQTITNIPGHAYAVPAPNPQTGLVQTTWPVAFSITIPSSWVSGMYLVKMTAANGYQSYIPFVVTATRNSAFLLIHTANTDAAYNDWGGTSLYGDHTGKLPQGRAYKVSFDRPLFSNMGSGYMLAWEYPMVRWLEASNYDVGYATDVDVHTNASILLKHQSILLAGHSEYWSKPMRDNLESAVGSGVNLGVFGANTMYWQIRYESSSSSVANRVLTCYKDAAVDPLYGKDNTRVTVQFRQNPVNRPEQSILGSMYDSYFAEDAVMKGSAWVPTISYTAWVFKGASLNISSQIPGIVGYEYDRAFDEYPQPATLNNSGVDYLSISPVTDVYGNQSTSTSTMYTAPSGARVFNAGTIQWSWGLDPWTLMAVPPNVANSATKQITANILQNFLSGTTSPAQVQSTASVASSAATVPSTMQSQTSSKPES